MGKKHAPETTDCRKYRQKMELKNLFSRKYLNCLNGLVASYIYGKFYWFSQSESLNVFLQLLECGGNLFDAASIAVKAALFNTR